METVFRSVVVKNVVRGDFFLGAVIQSRKAPVTFIISVCLSVWPHASTQLSLDYLFEVRHWGFLWTSVEKFQIRLGPYKTDGQFTSVTTMFLCCRRHKFAVNHFCTILHIFTLLTVTPNSTVHTECIVSSPQQQWLGEIVALLLYCLNFYLPKVRRQNMVLNIINILQNMFIWNNGINAL